ncbi:MAG: hypothetical protein V1734_03070 [Nanoarchaeota archaeon]
MAQDELSDILLKSVDDSVNIAIETKGYKPHYAMDSDMAFEYNVVLTNYLRTKKRDEFSDRLSYKEFHKYLVNMSRFPDAKPVKKQEDDSNSDYDLNESPKVKPINLESIAAKAKNIGTAGLIVSSAGAAYSIMNPAVLASAIGFGFVSAGILALGFYIAYNAKRKQGIVEDKSIGNKKDMRKAYALLQETDFMALGGVLESNRELIAEKLKLIGDKQ